MNRSPKTDLTNTEKLVRPLVRQMRGYIPGEQPRIKGLIKLNTNENPYPPSPKVLAAVREAVDERLRLYPNPTSQLLREKLAAFHRCHSRNIIVGNGSDDLLAVATRGFVEPAFPKATRKRSRPSGSTVQFFTPSYSLYPVLAEIHGAAPNAVPLGAGFAIPSVEELRSSTGWDFKAALTFVTTPNAPSGRGYLTTELEVLCAAQNGVVVLDEAYVNFADETALRLALKYPHVLVARTFSKAFSLCFQRVGYFVGHPELIAALDKVRDSYNVNGLGQIAAVATLKDLPYYRANFKRIIATRNRVSGELADLGFTVLPSQTNFILARPPKFPAEQWLNKLRLRRILVRWFNNPECRKYLRITVGTDEQMDSLIQAARGILK
jgi:histidinol-phosphate aminotransferase